MDKVQVIQKSINKTKHEKPTVASGIIKQLEKLGVDSIFGYPGASVLSLYNELSKSKLIKHYLVRHEQAAMHAAEGYARINGKPGVVIVTSGPGFTNTITGIANAYSDSTPLVVLAGDVSNINKSDKTFQNVDILSMVKTCSKKVYMLKTNDNAQELICKAYKEADEGVKGPVIIGLPRNILESVQKQNDIKSTLKKVAITHDYTSEIKKLNNLIKSSLKPLIIVGGGAMNASEEIFNLANNLKCPVVSTLMGIGIYPSSNDNYLGMVGINGNYIANSALNKCDLLISLGVSFSERTTCKNKYFARNSKIVNINIKNADKQFELNIKSDIKDFLTQYLPNIYKVSDNIWNTELKSIKAENINIQLNDYRLDSPSVLKIISEYTSKYEPVVVTDVGQHQMLTAQFFTFNKPRKFITSGGMGTMGFGLPAAIGAQIANPNQLILNITGDGSFQMNLQELATCREHHIPIKIIILNNGSLGMVRQLQEKMYKNTFQVNMINPDFTKIAEAYDLYAIRVTKKAEIIPALNKIISHKGTAIMDIMIDSHENI